MPEENFTTPGQAMANLAGLLYGSGKNMRQFVKDLNEYNIDLSAAESEGGFWGEALGALGFLKVLGGGPIVGAITSLLGGYFGREYAENQFRDEPTREDYEIMFGEDALQDLESQFALDQEQYSDMNQFLKSLDVTSNIMMSLYGPEFLGEMFGGGSAKAATAKAGAASVLESGTTVAGAKQAGQSALSDYLLK